MNNVVKLKDIDLNFRNAFDAISYVSASGAFDLTTLFWVSDHLVGDLLTKEGYLDREIMRSLEHNVVIKLTDEFAEGILDKNPYAFDGKVLLIE